MPEPVEKTTMPTKEEIQAKMNALAASFGEARENINCLAGSICDVRAHTEKLQKIYKGRGRIKFLLFYRFIPNILNFLR